MANPTPLQAGKSGIISQPDLLPPFPTLQKVTPPDEQPAVRMGEVLALGGHHLDGDENVSVAAHFTNARSPNTLELPALSGKTSTGFQVQVPDPTFNQATVNVVENTRLLVLPGGSDPHAEVTFAGADNDQTAEKLLLTQTNTLKATLSGEHAASPDLPAASQVAVTINARTGTLTLNFPPGAALADIAPLLQSAIRALFPLYRSFCGCGRAGSRQPIARAAGGEIRKSGSRSPTSRVGSSPTCRRRS